MPTNKLADTIMARYTQQLDSGLDKTAIVAGYFPKLYLDDIEELLINDMACKWGYLNYRCAATLVMHWGVLESDQWFACVFARPAPTPAPADEIALSVVFSAPEALSDYRRWFPGVPIDVTNIRDNWVDAFQGFADSSAERMRTHASEMMDPKRAFRAVEWTGPVPQGF